MDGNQNVGEISLGVIYNDDDEARANQQQKVVTYPPAARRIPSGLRFHPTDQELLVEYLMRKIFSNPIPTDDILDIDAADFYASHPKEIVEGISPVESKWYYYIKHDPNTLYHKLTREVRNGSGFWQMEDPEFSILNRQGTYIIGSKYNLRFFVKGSHKEVPKRTHWRMTEFRLSKQLPRGTDNKNIG